MSIPEWKLVGWTEGPRECALRCEAVNCTFATADGRHAAADGQFIGVSLLHCQMGVARVAAPMSEERLIKKYANRRLYDASQSRHITLDDIRNLVVAGVRVKVIEDKTNADITRVILLQVIADQEQFGAPILSTPLLEALIRFYGNSLQSFLSAHLEKSVESFMSEQKDPLKEASSG
jgi:polyhydroxyalkanoate synthesis repressor PhaR